MSVNHSAEPDDLADDEQRPGPCVLCGRLTRRSLTCERCSRMVNEAAEPVGMTVRLKPDGSLSMGGPS